MTNSPNPHPLTVEAILAVQLRPIDCAIAEAQAALAECRHLAQEMNRKVGGYEALISMLITKRNLLAEQWVAAASR